MAIAYGLLANYGLRPHEVFCCNLDKFPILQVKEGTETGQRRVYPFYPEWCEMWNLSEGVLSRVSGKTNSDLGSRVSHQFSRYKIPFPAYNLRHSWAVRSMEFGLDISLAAQQMGHSVRVHSKIYHAWISEEVHQRAYEALMMRSDRPRPPTSLQRNLYCLLTAFEVPSVGRSGSLRTGDVSPGNIFLKESLISQSPEMFNAESHLSAHFTRGNPVRDPAHLHLQTYPVARIF